MIHLLNLLAAIALLVWGTHIVRTGMLRVFGENLRRGPGAAAAATASARRRRGLGVTSLVQSSTATCLIVASFVGKDLVTTSAALAVMLGADIGTSADGGRVLARPVVAVAAPDLRRRGRLHLARETTASARFGRVAIGLGLITLALQLIVAATRPLTESPEVRALLVALPNEILLDIVVGAVLTVLVVLEPGGRAARSRRSPPRAWCRCRSALGLVLGANLGSGMLAMLATAHSSAAGAARAARQPDLQGCSARGLILVFLPHVHGLLRQLLLPLHQQVVGFHLAFNVVLAVLFIGLHRPDRPQLVDRWLREPRAPAATDRPRHLDPLALDTPSLAISCAAREALHQADMVETMLRGILPVLRKNDLKLAEAAARSSTTRSTSSIRRSSST